MPRPAITVRPRGTTAELFGHRSANPRAGSGDGGTNTRASPRSTRNRRRSRISAAPTARLSFGVAINGYRPQPPALGEGFRLAGRATPARVLLRLLARRPCLAQDD